MSDEGRLVAGRYRLVELIGRGGMGTVWRADDEVLDRHVALKQLHVQPHLSDAELATQYERTRREARAAARVVHPNVVVVHDVVDDDGRPCIVMEYLPAVTLGELLEHGRTIPPEEAARIGLGMVAALRAAHTAGVLHRDVKPGNVMLGAGDRVVLTDFGIAVTSGSSTLTRTGEMVGSIDFMAPERIRGQRPGPASDLWALGATLYQAVEGRPPFRRDTAVETAYAIVVDPMEPMKRAGPLEPLIEALLFKEPEERPTAEQTERALRAARSSAQTAALAPDWSTDSSSGPDTSSGPDRASGTTVGQSSGRPSRRSPGGEPEAPVWSSADTGPERRRGRRRGRVLVPVVAVVAAAAAGVGVIQNQSDPDEHAPSAATHSPGRTTASASPSPLPEGYRSVREEGLDISFPVPEGWKATRRAADEVVYTDPTGLAGITIGMVDPAGSNPMAHFTDIETNTKVNYPTYRRLRMQETRFQGQPAAVWEFTFHGKARLFRAIDLGFGREGGREYDVYLSAPDADWDRYRPVFDNVRDGFARLGD
ncbi:serine/threonine-protein kinase [Streptomyces griseus]|uniref:serine/threonine-protein kinase n=1 Tax=Streptomyces griseus TaxID=1911 RepID=UPI0005674189|nr:serine/threonine-protein kinase [Streptomyces griseus]